MKCTTMADSRNASSMLSYYPTGPSSSAAAAAPNEVRRGSSSAKSSASTASIENNVTEISVEKPSTECPLRSAEETSAPPRSKHWCFTMNNYTEEDVQRLSSLKKISGLYLIYGFEVGESGTPHLQGFVSFPSRKRLNQCIKALGQCHFSIARSISKSINYCKKDGNFVEIGTPPEPPYGAGKRNDLERFKNDVKEGEVDLRTLRENHSTVFARYARFAEEYVRDHCPTYNVPVHPLRPWQSELNAKLNGEVDPREIVFLIDVVGNQGKSWFFRYYEQNHPKSTQIIIPGKKADMAYVLRVGNRVVLFDCPRSKQGEYVQYDFLEEVKNGYVFSGKYEARIKRFGPPHVVVAMNEWPNMEMLSNDRYKCIELK